MKKFIFVIMLVFMSISCRAGISSANSEELGHGKPQESNERVNTANEEDDFLGGLAGLFALVLFGWWVCSYDECSGQNW